MSDNTKSPVRRVKVIGFCDVADKPHGMESVVLFDDRHHFVADWPPNAGEVRKYATEHGYYPSGRRGASPDRFDAVYVNHGAA